MADNRFWTDAIFTSLAAIAAVFLLYSLHLKLGAWIALRVDMVLYGSLGALLFCIIVAKAVQWSAKKKSLFPPRPSGER
jgi:hypothetical protein